MMHFFGASDSLDHAVLRPLSHVRPAWELTWDDKSQQYKEEKDSFAGVLNTLIRELAIIVPPDRYHDSEDQLAEFVLNRLHWAIRKVGQRWVGSNYDVILQQGSFDDVNQRDLLLAVAGRIQAARERGQIHFDEMEVSHQRMLGAVMAVILWQRDRLEG